MARKTLTGAALGSLLSSGKGRPVEFAGRAGNAPSFSAAVGAMSTDEDSDDEDGADVLDSHASALGLSANRYRQMLLGLSEDYAVQSEDGVVIKFCLSTDTATEVESVEFTDGTTKILQVMSSTKGWFVPYIEFDLDGVGANDTVSGRLTISGHRTVPEVKLIKSNGLDLAWGRILVPAHQFTLRCPSATVANPVRVLIAANGMLAKPEHVAAVAKAARTVSGPREREVFSKRRAKVQAAVREVAERAASTMPRFASGAEGFRVSRKGR